MQDVRRRMEHIEAQRTDGKYLVRMAERLFDGLGGSIRYTGKRTIMDVPKDIRYGPLAKRRITHGAPPDEVLARGGRLYDHLEEWIRRHCSNDLKFGSVFRDPGGFDGHVVFHAIPIYDKGLGLIGKPLVAHKYADGEVTSVDPSILHDMKYDDGTDAGPAPRMDDVQKAALDMARAEADRMAAERKKFWEHRTKAATERMMTEAKDIRQKMGSTGFGAERNALDARLSELERRQKEVDDEHETAVTLTPHAPILEGWVRVVPDSAGPRDGQDTERIGMEVSMAHERSEGFEVDDVSGKHNIGYDLLSTHSDGRRREIEVKGRCDMGGIDLTESEYEHAKSSKHAVIHVISNAGRPDQRLDIISDTSDIRATKRTVYTAQRTEIRRLAD